MSGYQPPQHDPRQQQRARGQQSQPGYGQPYPQQPQVYVQQNNQHPRESVTMTGMSGGEMAFHWLMIICSCGLWWPIYAARKHAADRKSVTRYH